MADPFEVDEEEISVPEKIVREYIPVQELLEQLFADLNYAEGNMDRRPPYLTRIYDELSVIATVKYVGNPSGLVALLLEWTELETRYGAIDEDSFRGLKSEEWRERKRALIGIRERLGMGTSAPTSKYEPGDPMEAWRVHGDRECPEDCPMLVSMRKRDRLYE